MKYRYTGHYAIEAPRDFTFERTADAPTGQGRDILPGEVIEINGDPPMPYYEKVTAKARKPRAKAAPRKAKTTKEKAEPGNDAPKGEQSKQGDLAPKGEAP